MRRQVKRTDPSGIEILASNHEDESSEIAITSGSNLLARLFLQRSRDEVAQPSRPRFIDRIFRRRRDAQASIPDSTPTSSVLELPRDSLFGVNVENLGAPQPPLGCVMDRKLSWLI